MNSALLLVLNLLAPAESDSVYGAVRDAITGAPVAGVRVETGAGGPTALSTTAGAYSLATVPSGLQSLNFSRDGYDSFQLRVVVPAGSSLHVDVALQPVPVALPQLEVAGADSSSQAGGFTSPGSDSLEIGLHRYRRDSLWSDPLVTSDDPLLAAATSTDGAARTGTLHVHGGSGDQNLLLLDGLPVYGAMHLGGASGLLNPDAVANVDLHSAVPPASLGGRLSSAVELHLLPPGEGPLRMTGAWDQTSVRQLVEGSFARGAGSFLVSGRQSYRGVFAQDGDGWRSNGFHDLLARGTFASRGDEIRLYLLNTGDRLSFPAAVGPTGPRNRFSWSSTTAGAVWTRSRASGPTLTTRLWSASSAAGIAWSPAAGSVGIGSGLREIGFSSELLVGGGSARQRLGVSLQRTATAFEMSSTTASARLHSAPTILNAFVEDRRTLGRWSTLAGLRATSVNATELTFEPRLSVRYRLTPGVTLSAGAARLHQYVQSMRNEESLLDHAFAAELPVSLGAGGLGPARSDQVSAELETRIGPSFTLTFEGYARRFNGLLVPAAATAAPFAIGLPPLASGHAAGLKLQARYSGNSLEARVALGLASTQRDLGPSEFFPGSLRSRWATAGIARRFGQRTSVRLAATVSDGGPTSVLQTDVEWQSPGGLGASGEISGSPQGIVGSLNGARLPLFFRTDLGLTREWRIGMAGRFTTALTVSNLFNRANVLGYAQNGSDRRVLLFPSRSLLAQVGWAF
jgi:Carboxypeptidase regulatory-like domain/TonB dependent receptor